jgi:hypothetical protein
MHVGKNPASHLYCYHHFCFVPLFKENILHSILLAEWNFILFFFFKS